MKLTFSTLGCPELSFEEILSITKKYNMNSFELRGILDAISVDSIKNLYPENRSKTKEMLSSIGISICLLGCSSQMHTEREKAIRECLYAIDTAEELNIPFIRVFGNKCQNDEMFNYVSDGLKEVCLAADSKGITVLIESHGDFVTADILSHLIKSVDMPNLGILWDVEHTHRANESESDFANIMLPYIRHVHFKNVTADGRQCLPSEGIIDLKKTAKLLTDLGYNGYFSLEWEKRWHSELPQIQQALDNFVNIFISN